MTKQQRHRKNLKKEALTQYGKECAHCGESWPGCLHLHHKSGERPAEHAKLRTAESLSRRLKAEGWPPLIEVLCAVCHMREHARLDGIFQDTPTWWL
jgi:hypothetical protein